MRISLIAVSVCVVASCFTGCQSMYYGTMEKFGVHKREILVDRVSDARDEQEEAKEQFASALEAFTSVVNVQPSELQARYDVLKKELDRSESAAGDVRNRINKVEDVSEALFREWETELEAFSSPEMRSSSERQLRETRGRYEQLMTAMRRAESRMDPVLGAFRDQVLYLKHNLNAQAIASLQDEFVALESDIAVLIREMETAIEEASAFIDTMEL